MHFRIDLLAVPRLLLLVLCASGLPLNAQAANQPEPLVWLEAQQYAALDHHYAGLQAQYQSGRISDRQLYEGFKALYEDSPANRVYFDAWVAAFPKSYAARLARGAYFYRMAWASRGADYISNTSAARIAEMQRYLDLARPDLEASLRLTARPFISTLYLLNVVMMGGPDQERRQWLDRGNLIDPSNLLLRSRYMVSLSPKWGGSYARMHGFLLECRRQHLPEAQLAALELPIAQGMAEYADRIGDAQGAFVHWDKVLELTRDSGDVPDQETLINHAYAATQTGNRPQADDSLRQLAAMNVQTPWILSRMGWIYIGEKRMPEAWAVIRKAADGNDGWAQYSVGLTYMFGCPDIQLQSDPDIARTWLNRSASNGFAQGRQFERYDAWSHTLGWIYLFFTKG